MRWVDPAGFNPDYKCENHHVNSTAGVLLPCQVNIDPLHSDITLEHFRTCPFGSRHVGDQKCIAVIERKTLIVSLLTNAGDYSSETTIFVRYKHIP